MIKEYKLNKKIWKNREEFDKYFNIFINTPKRKKKKWNKRWINLATLEYIIRESII